ncbi:MAG: homoserine O-succinyltransferase [Bacteroidales bacterium]|nr:homoserine O-succinyltransferase [Bacteroidales bacterium]
MIIVPKKLPLISKLNSEGCNLTDDRNVSLSPLKILIVNLMPEKEEAEADLYRALDVLDVPVEITLAKMSNLVYKHTPQEYMNTYYQDISEIMESGQDFDALIMNGAPFERFEYEEILYWKQLCVFFRWTDKHVKSSFLICWSAFARIYYDCGIHFKRNSFQWSGVYPHAVLDKTTELIDNSLSEILLPVSRPWYLSHDELAQVPDIQIVAESSVTGPGLMVAYGGRHIYAIGHPEYAPERIRFEYLRDCENGKNPMFPFNYFCDNDLNKQVNYSWKVCRDMIFSNWIHKYVKNL